MPITCNQGVAHPAFMQSLNWIICNGIFRSAFNATFMSLMVTILNLQICERSLTSSTGGPTGPPASCFVRAEMLPSGYLIRPCDGGGSIIHIVDHIDLDVRD